MPITSITRVYKNFPISFADRVSQHVKKRAETYINFRDTEENEDQEDKEIADYSVDSGHCGGTKKTNREQFGNIPACPSFSKRPRTPLAIISDESDNDNSPRSGQSTPRTGRTTPMSPIIGHPDISPRSGRSTPLTGRNNPTQTYCPDVSPRSGRNTPSTGRSTPSQGNADSQDTSDKWPFMPAFHTLNFSTPRLLRNNSRTTVSLDNVDLWESDSEECDSSGHFDQINGVLINPRKTFDFSELRRSRSPMTAVNESDDPPLLAQTEPITSRNRSPRSRETQEKRAKPRVRMNRRMKSAMLPSPAKCPTEPKHTDSPKNSPKLQKTKKKKVPTATLR